MRHDATAVVSVALDAKNNRIVIVDHKIRQPSPHAPLNFEATVEQYLLQLSKRFRVAEVRFVKRIPAPMTVTRYLGGLVRSQVEHLSAVLWQLTARRLRAPALGAVLDLDSTVFERYGHQQGSLKGYNPRKHGRPENRACGERAHARPLATQRRPVRQR